MSKSVKLPNNVYIDTSGISHNMKPLNKQIPKNINQEFYAGNLNEFLETGQCQYNTGTLNTPYKQNSSYDKYGLVIVIGNNFDTNFNYYWVFQLVLGTSGGIYFRSSINKGAFSNWIKII